MKNILTIFIYIALASAWAGAETRVALVLHSELGDERRELKGATNKMLSYQLEQEKGLALVETREVVAALEKLGLRAADVSDAARAASLGQFVQAEVVVAARLRVGAYRISARVIEVESGRALAEESVAGKEQQIFDLVDVLGARLSGVLKDGRYATFAVLPFANLADEEYRLFVRGLSDLLSAGLSTTAAVSAVERGEIEKAFQALEQGLNLSAADAVALGKWLGADVVVMGEFDEMLALDVRAMESEDGTVIGEVEKEGSARDWSVHVDELGAELARDIMVAYKDIRKVAVLYFQNHAGEEHDGFVQGIADMLMTSLGQSENLQLIERVQIDRAMSNFNLELSGAIDTEKAVEVGAWLGADAVVLGSFTKFGDIYRIDARLIDAETGELLVAQNARGAEAEVMALVDELGTQLIDRFADRMTEVVEGIGTLKIRFAIARAEMGERPVYFHICKIYVDGQYMGMSPVAKKVDREVVLFDKSVQAGAHQVKIVHGFVKDAQWDGEMPLQPKVFHVAVEPDGTATVRYQYEVGWFEDLYVYRDRH